jgi:hypothetical protein
MVIGHQDDVEAGIRNLTGEYVSAENIHAFVLQNENDDWRKAVGAKSKIVQIFKPAND